MEGLFSQVFRNISLDSQCFQDFSNTYISQMHYAKREKSLYVHMEIPQFIHESSIDKFKQAVTRQIPDIQNVVASFHYKLAPDNIQNILTQYWDNVLYFLCSKGPLYDAIFKDAKWEFKDNTLLIHVKNQSAYLLHKKNIDRMIEEKLFEQLGLSIRVCFQDQVVSSEEKAHYNKRQERLEQEIASQMISYIPEPIAAQTDVRHNKNENGLLFGKPIKSAPVAIEKAKTEGEEVTIKGEIIRLEAREIKGGKLIVSFDITDLTDSTSVKFFIKKEKWDAIKDVCRTGSCVTVYGENVLDRFKNELSLMAKSIQESHMPPKRRDSAPEKRVELHLHTQMSSMDAINSVNECFQKAKEFGHKAMAVTDHGVVQAFPDAMDASKKTGVKAIYGVEAYFVNDLGAVVQSAGAQTLDDEMVIFDIETTGLSKERDKIIEIAGVKIKNRTITDSFSSFVNPHQPLSQKIMELTGITDDMLKDAPDIQSVLPEFLAFSGNAVLVAHNAAFDVGFVRQAADRFHREITNPVLDTLELSRALFPELSRHKLDIVCKHLDISLDNHHRAIDDAKATAQVLLKCLDLLDNKGIRQLEEINVLSSQSENYKKLKAYHAIILVKNQTGLKNLYQLISSSHIRHFFKRPRILKSEFIKHREGLLLGTACEAGELYQAILDKQPDIIIENLVRFYDYIEIQPISNNHFLIREEKVASEEILKDINRKLCLLGERFKKPVAATCDVHFLDPEEEIFRRIILHGEGYKDTDEALPLYYRTTEEMLAEFSYLGEEKAYEVVVQNTNAIADCIEEVLPLPSGTFTPEMEGAEQELRDMTTAKAIEIYGSPLPEPVSDRLNRELDSIIKNGFAVLYIIAQKLVKQSMENGYLVGSRGSVGSSLAATMAGITEVNPLPPHYICRQCHFSDFDSEEVLSYAGYSGCDMPDRKCPVCGTQMNKEGHDIPFETFLGFDGDKEPDIDLNFSGEYQQAIHNYTEELFGSGHVFKAGTIGTMADKTAYGYVKKYTEEKKLYLHSAEMGRLAAGCTGVKRTTGQHPGGLMIVPMENDIHEFCPIQRPANDMKSAVTTTHFDYHSLSGRLLKLDLLGHDDPTVIRMLYDLTGKNPQEVPLDDAKTMSLFTGTEALGVRPEDINCDTGTLGVPEFGTRFVRQMLQVTKPQKFSDLIRIAGLSHGTDVWLNNAQDYIRQGIVTLKDVISTRDDIMTYLISKGLEKKTAFKIMENVRKGKGLSADDIAVMEENNVPGWYIESCQKIKYMFPKAHAAAYVMMAFRIAYFKVNYPASYYASYFSVRAEDFDYVTMCKGEKIARDTLKNLEAKGLEMTAKDKNSVTVLEIVIEMYARGFSFLPLDLYRSDGLKFQVLPEGLLPPFISVAGLGANAAQSIIAAREDGEFLSVQEFKQRTKVSKTTIEMLQENGILKGLPETNQLSLF